MAKSKTKSFDDLGFEESIEDSLGFEEESKPEADISKRESFQKGLEQGTTFGFADELRAGLSAGMDKGQELLNKLGIMGPSPSQVNADLAKRGFTGDIGPQSAGETYDLERDAARQDYKAASEANPGSSLVGNIVGGGLTIAAAPVLAAPFGESAAGASLAARAGKMAANAAPAAALLGAGNSEANPLEQPGQFAKDVAIDTTLGAGMAGVLPLAGAGVRAVEGGLNKLENAMVPDAMKVAYDRGMDGINTTTEQFYKDTLGKVKGLVSEVAAPIMAKSQAQKKAYDQVVKGTEEALELAQNEARNSIELQKAKQIAGNKADIDAINRETVQTAKKLQNHISKVKKDLGSQYDEIEAGAEAAGIFPDNKLAISNFMSTVMDKSTLQPGQVNAILGKVQPILGQKSQDAFKQTKQLLVSYFDHGDPVVRRAAKAAYADLKNEYNKDLAAGGLNELANRLQSTNKRWVSAMELEENYLSNLRPDRVTGEIEASPDTINAITNFTEKDPAKIAKAETIGKYMNVLDPEGSPKMLQEMQDLGSRTVQAKSFQPQVPTAEEAMAQNPKIAKLEGMLAQLKQQKPAKIEGLDLPTDEQALQNELTNLLPKEGMQTGNLVAENKLAQAKDFLAKEKSPEYLEDLLKRAKPVNEDVNLVNLKRGGLQDDMPVTKMGAVKKALGKGTDVANTAGRTVKETKNFLTKGIKRLADADGNTLQQIGAQLAKTGARGQEYANVLTSAAGKNPQSRSAIIFGLMQQPEFRELFHSVSGEDEDGQ